MRKRSLRSIICAVTAAILMCSFSITAFASDPDLGDVELSFSNAPQGTVFIDILVPIVWDAQHLTEAHDYTVKTRETYYVSHIDQEKLKKYGKDKATEWKETKSVSQNYCIDKKSEIAQYSKDGYVSLFAHTNIVRRVGAYNNYYDGESRYERAHILLSGSYQLKNKERDSDVDIYYLKDKFSDMKAAYIDKDGNILGITDKFDIDTHDSDYIFRADGNKLTLGLDDYNHWFTFRFIGVCLLYLILIVAVFVIIIVCIKWIVQGVKSSKEYDDK